MSLSHFRDARPRPKWRIRKGGVSITVTPAQTSSEMGCAFRMSTSGAENVASNGEHGAGNKQVLAFILSFTDTHVRAKRTQAQALTLTYTYLTNVHVSCKKNQSIAKRKKKHEVTTLKVYVREGVGLLKWTTLRSSRPCDIFYNASLSCVQQQKRDKQK